MSQTKKIKDIVNDYAKVTAISNYTVTLSSVEAASKFHPSDTVLLIQMTGVTSSGNISSAGNYEFHIVAGITNQTVTLMTAVVASTFTPGTELVQMIRVPSYRNAQIENVLTCQPWDWSNGTGGVLALIVRETLTFNDDIDVSGKGFKGAKAGDPYDGDCTVISAGDAGNYSINSSEISGFKGEGAAVSSLINNTPKGWGRAWNGGGGGNGKWSGGGGGANGGHGGNGDSQSCGIDFPGHSRDLGQGNSGHSFKYNEDDDYIWSGRALMGGGGGSGTGEDATPGGNGGGIVIIIAKNLEFSQNARIYAKGESVAGSPSKGGAGGGGAGGSIFLSVENYGDIKADVSGGNGGNVYRGNCNNMDNSRGDGGGGGGGFVMTTIPKESTAFYNNFNINRGVPGEIIVDAGMATCIRFSGNGDLGFFRGNFQVPLRGFLFNYFFTPDTTVCHDEQVIVRASTPKGGSGVYGYTWRYSSDTDPTWRQITASGNTMAILTDPTKPKVQLHFKEGGTFYIQRVVTSGGISDNGAPIKVIVKAAIENQTTDKMTVCWEEQKLVTIEGNHQPGYSFQWEKMDDDMWKTVSAESSHLSFTLPSIEDVTNFLFRRKVTLGSCESAWRESHVRVLPKINNVIAGNQEICGLEAKKLTGLELTGGAQPPDYKFQWQFRTNDSQDWEMGANEEDYQPESCGYGAYHFRRVVTSDVCESLSNEVTVHFYEQPEFSKILTPDADLTGEKALRFKFSTELIAAEPTAGSGMWSSPDEQLSFDRPSEPITTVNNLQFDKDNTIIWAVSNGVCETLYTSVIIKVDDVKRPTGFSPNNDGFNDCFRVLGAENATSAELIILDRYNKIVFESKSFNRGSSNLDDCTGWWDGRNSSGNELPSGTYFYQLTLNGKYIYKGHVVLKRQ